LNETNAAGMIDFGSFNTLVLSSSIWIITKRSRTQIRVVMQIVIGENMQHL
jgi:hypothetical protein